jgi:hypothetical protein
MVRGAILHDVTTQKSRTLHTHTHTHTYIYIYIYIVLRSKTVSTAGSSNYVKQKRPEIRSKTSAIREHEGHVATQNTGCQAMIYKSLFNQELSWEQAGSIILQHEGQSIMSTPYILLSAASERTRKDTTSGTNSGTEHLACFCVCVWL